MSQLTHDQIAQLVLQAQQDDQEAFAALYAATVDRQLYFATAFLKDAILAEDVVQEVYIKAFRSIKKLEKPKTFVAYLNRICYNTCVDYKKKLSQQKYELNEESLNIVSDVTPEHAPAEAYEIKESNSTLSHALQQLEEQQRTAFLMRYYYNMKIKEIATAMQISESTVKRYVKSASSLLQKLLTTH